MKAEYKYTAGLLAALLLAGTVLALPAQARWDEMIDTGKPYGITTVNYQPLPEKSVKQPGRTRTYLVKAGDTLWELAQKCGISVQALAAMNGITENSVLYIGQVLEMPAAAGGSRVKYTVKPGDNLYDICRRYQVTMGQLLAVNNIKNPNFVREGQTLAIPVSDADSRVVSALTAGGRLPVLAMEWPVKGRVSSPFGIRQEGRPHHGIDIAAPHGAAIKAPREGTVVYSGYYGTYGCTVIIDHGYGTRTLYAHCSRLFVKSGQWVPQGTVIAAVGNTGRSFGPHLHWEVQYKGVPYDPTLCLDAEKLFLAARS
ncbi:MAG: M23 family metallopeptidase [Desulfotomaculum sp.]|nr:M23 family metallopeptidase [Desulfotomaculum sp.]